MRRAPRRDEGRLAVGDPLTQRQHRVLQTIERFLQDEGYTPSVREIGAVLGLAPATVQQHLEVLERKGYIRRSGQSHGIEILSGGMPGGIVNVPIVGEIAAGVPIDAYEERLDTIAVTADVSPDGTAYALRVRGDSMVEDHICDGDIVIVDPVETVRDGEIGVAMLDDGSVTLKRIFREDDRVRLQPANAEMAPIYADEIRVRGRVTSIMRRL